MNIVSVLFEMIFFFPKRTIRQTTKFFTEFFLRGTIRHTVNTITAITPRQRDVLIGLPYNYTNNN